MNPFDLGSAGFPQGGLCVGMGAEGDIFHPTTGGHTERAAKDMCNLCPIREGCLEWAIERDEREGIWGALTTPQRDAFKAERLELAA